MPKANSSLIVIILDRSGSMQSVREATIKGFNEFLKGQQEAPGEAKISLIQFDNAYEVNYLAKPIREARPLDSETYQPRGNTALLDAIGRAIIETGKTLAAMDESDRPSKVIVVIQTDGEENASSDFKRPQVFDMIKHQREAYKWDFVFLGADQDAIGEAASLGIGAASAMSYQNTNQGNAAVYNALNAATTRSRATTDSLSFTDDEKGAAANA